jgi:hypothetical protein
METAAAIERLMQGAIDFHVHAGPDPFRVRRLDALELARTAQEAGMRAVVAKNHQFGTAPLTQIVNGLVPGFTLLGSLTLNREVGGLNSDVVAAHAKAGAKVLWMPTASSVIDSKGKPGISLMDEKKKLLPEVMDILDIIRKSDMVLGTGHVAMDEIYALVTEARGMKIRVTVTHPLSSGFGCTLSLDQQRELVSMGAFIEHAFAACMPILGGLRAKTMIDTIRGVGVEYCILSTDFGQLANPSPPEGFRMMIGTLLELGLSEGELKTLVKTGPARVLGLT